MPAVRAMDKGEASKINEKLTYKLPLDAANGRVYLDKSPNLSDAQLDALDKLGSPSQLRLMYLAEGGFKRKGSIRSLFAYYIAA